MSDPLRVVSKEESWRQEVNEDVIEVLEDILAQAKTGEIDGVAIAATTKDGCAITTYSKRNKSTLLLGGLTRLTHRLAGD